MEKYQLINQLDEKQVKALHKLFQNEWWTCQRKYDEIKMMLKQSDIVIAFWDHHHHRLLAFARVLTDFLYRAYVCDVIVHPSARGNGIGRRLMEEIDKHVASIERVELLCQADKIEFYAKMGFDPLHKGIYMRKNRETKQIPMVELIRKQADT